MSWTRQRDIGHYGIKRVDKRGDRNKIGIKFREEKGIIANE